MGVCVNLCHLIPPLDQAAPSRDHHVGSSNHLTFQTEHQRTGCHTWGAFLVLLRAQPPQWPFVPGDLQVGYETNFGISQSLLLDKEACDCWPGGYVSFDPCQIPSDQLSTILSFRLHLTCFFPQSTSLRSKTWFSRMPHLNMAASSLLGLACLCILQI